MICSQNDIKCYKDFQLTNFNTLRIKSTAKLFYMPDNYGEMISLFKKHKENTPVVIGAGSNILLSSLTIDQPVIHTERISGIKCQNDTIEVETGYKTQALSKYALYKNLSGFEFLIGIPASLGGAVYMNAGAHNQSVSDKFVSAKVYDYKEDKIKTIKKDEMNFSYRHSVLQEKPYILLSAKFKLEKKENSEIKSKMDENLIFRKNRQPNLSIPNAGSVFKNPENCEFSAGALIDKCGFRGYKSGDCQVWENHCNFIINKGSATSCDYTNLIFEIYSKVKEEYNVKLTPEIIFIGKMTKDEKEKWKILKS